MIAEQIMQKKVVTAQPSMTLKELAAMLVDHQITGAPVINSAGMLVGVISQTDLVRHDREQADRPQAAGGYYSDEYFKPGLWPRQSEETRVRDCMTPLVLSASRADDVLDLARMMLEHRVHRMIISEEGKLYGIVTTMDLVRALVDLHEGKRRARPARKGRKS